MKIHSFSYFALEFVTSILCFLVTSLVYGMFPILVCLFFSPHFSCVCVFWGAICPKQSRLFHLAHGAKESRVRSSLPTHKPNKHPMWTVTKSPQEIMASTKSGPVTWTTLGRLKDRSSAYRHKHTSQGSKTLQAGQLSALLAACSSESCKEASRGLDPPLKSF